MQKATKNPMFQLKEERYKNATIYYFMSPLPIIQPGYSFIDDYLVVAVNKSLLQQSIDAQNDKSLSLAEKPSFRTLDDGFHPKKVLMCFLQKQVN